MRKMFVLGALLLLASFQAACMNCGGRQCGVPKDQCEDGKVTSMDYCDETDAPAFTRCGGDTCVLGSGPCPSGDGGVLDGG